MSRELDRRAFLLSLAAAANAFGDSGGCGAGSQMRAVDVNHLEDSFDPSVRHFFGSPLSEQIPAELPDFRMPPAPPQLQKRVNAASLGSAASLRDAYGMMRAATGRHGLTCQAAVHYEYCSHSASVHQPTDDCPGIFLVWHRAFIFFHERLLRWHLSKAGRKAESNSLRLPYWHTDLSPSGGPPGAYSNPACNPLYADRLWKPSKDAASDASNLIAGLHATKLEDCAKSLFTWHVAVHDAVGKDFKNVQISAGDPLFYAWHANVDRAWAGSNQAAPTDIGQKKFVLFDPFFNDGKGSWVRVSADQFISASRLGYEYDIPMDREKDVSDRVKSVKLYGRHILTIDLMNGKLPALHGATGPVEIGYKTKLTGYQRICGVPGTSRLSHPPSRISVDLSELSWFMQWLSKLGGLQFVLKIGSLEYQLETTELSIH